MKFIKELLDASVELEVMEDDCAIPYGAYPELDVAVLGQFTLYDHPYKILEWFSDNSILTFDSKDKRFVRFLELDVYGLRLKTEVGEQYQGAGEIQHLTLNLNYLEFVNFSLTDLHYDAIESIVLPLDGKDNFWYREDCLLFNDIRVYLYRYKVIESEYEPELNDFEVSNTTPQICIANEEIPDGLEFNSIKDLYKQVVLEETVLHKLLPYSTKLIRRVIKNDD